MAAAHVQSVSADSATALAYGSNVTAGTLLIAIVRRGGTGSQPITITDTVGSTWQKAIEVTEGSDHTNGLWWAVAAGSGANTVTQNGGSGTSRMAIAEYSGLTSPTTDGSPASNTGNGTAPTVSVTTGVTDAAIIAGYSERVGVGAFDDGTNGIHRTSAAQKVALGDRLAPGGAGTYAVDLSLTATDDWSAVAQAFKDTSAAAPVRLKRRCLMGVG